MHSSALKRLFVSWPILPLSVQEIKKEIDEAIEKAKAAPQPAAGELWTNIYVGE